MKAIAIILCIFISELVLPNSCNDIKISKPSTQNNYNYTSHGTVCLMVSMKASFKLENETYNVTKDARVDYNKTTCGNLTVNIGNNNSFSLVFNETNNNKSYFLSQVSAILLDRTFINNSLSWGKVVMQQSYKCAKGLTVTMGKATFMATNIQFQAYGVKNSKFGSSKDCNDLSPIIPIVVGAVLGVLVLIVIVAYLIGRRRSRSGYEEI